MAPSLKNISDQVIVLTGASSGIGMATAELAARKGAKLVLVARSEGILRRMTERLGSESSQLIYATADVASREQLQEVAAKALRHFGRIDTWINDAGVSIYGKLEEVSEEDNKRLFETNFWGVVNGSLVALPHLKKQGGALINVGSEVSEAVVPLQGMYSASKHAVKGFTDALRVEIENVDEAPVSITLIQPTAVNTPFPQHAKNYMRQEPKLPTPMIAPEKVAEAIINAASSHQRDVKVGLMAHVNTAITKLAPETGDAMAAKQADRQQYNESPRNSDGILYQASNDGRMHGTGGPE